MPGSCLATSEGSARRGHPPSPSPVPPKNATARSCSWCGKPDGEVKLVASLQVRDVFGAFTIPAYWIPDEATGAELFQLNLCPPNGLAISRASPC